MIEIIKTKPTDKDFHLFKTLPTLLYNAEQQAFNSHEGINLTFLKSGYVLLEDGRPKARMALYDNPSLFYKGKKSVCIGNYECVNDLEIAKKLFQAVLKDIQSLDCEYIIGPMNGSTWDNYRFSVHHNTANISFEPYHHLYYNDHFQAFGMEVIGKYFSSKDTALKHDFPNILQQEAAFKAKGVQFREVQADEFESVLERLYDFNIHAFQTNFLYTPISKAAFMEKYAPIKKIIHPKFLIIAENAQKELICFFFCIHDFANRTEKSLIIKTIARHPAPEWRGLGHVTGNIIYRNAVEAGYQSVIHAFMFGDGYSTTISKNFSGAVYKNYVLYGRNI